MEIKELQNRINKKQEQILKLEKKVQRLTLNDPYNDLRRAQIDLEESKVTLQKYLNALSVEEQKANTKKIDIIWQYLLNYKNKVREWLEENKQWKHKYYELSSKYCNMWNSRKYTREELEKVNKEEKEARNNIHPYTDKFYSTHRGWNEEELEKQLLRDITNQYFELIDRVTKFTGEITDASNLHIRVGELNGIISGTKGKAKIETIGAGGYNIQCFHYRTLVKEVK